MAKIRWNVRAFEEIRRSAGVEAELQKVVDRVLSSTGDGYVGGVEPGKTRSRGYVVTGDLESAVDNAENHSLLRALGGGL